MSSSFHEIPGPIPDAYDPQHAADVLQSLSKDGPAALADENFRALLEATAGNSPYLARLMLREKLFLDDIYEIAPDALLASLNEEALGMKYTHDSSTVDPALRTQPAADQNCANCAQLQGEDGAEWRPCAIFVGKLVNANGWCSVWVPKA